MAGPTQTVLQTGLGGAIGCDFRTAQNQLIFVEYSGYLSALTVAPATLGYIHLGIGYNTPEDVKLSVDSVENRGSVMGHPSLVPAREPMAALLSGVPSYVPKNGHKRSNAARNRHYRED
jgi:hypothetical protein